MKKPNDLVIGNRTDMFCESVISEMTQLAGQTGAINLSQGLPDIDPPEEVLEAAVSAIRSGENQYSDTFGMTTFRQAIAEKYRRDNQMIFNPESEITVTCGVSGAVMTSILSLTEPGDEVILFEPCYENYVPDCMMAGVTPVFFQMEGVDFLLDVDKLRKKLTRKTRLLILNNPHNPTGKVFSEEELLMIAMVCNDHNVIVVVDEIYEDFLYDGYLHHSIGKLDGMQDKTVTVGGLGKSYSVTGWRIGWIAAHHSLSKKIQKAHEFITVCAPTPFQSAGVVALNLSEDYHKSICETLTKRRDVLLRGLDLSGFDFYKPRGSYHVYVDFRDIEWPSQRYIKTEWNKDRAFAEYMAREVGLAIIPGSSFYYGIPALGENSFRLNFAKDEHKLQKAAALLEKHFG